MLDRLAYAASGTARARLSACDNPGEHPQIGVEHDPLEAAHAQRVNPYSFFDVLDQRGKNPFTANIENEDFAYALDKDEEYNH